MKMSVLSGSYIKYDKMCSDIDVWLENQLPLDICGFFTKVFSTASPAGITFWEILRTALKNTHDSRPDATV